MLAIIHIQFTVINFLSKNAARPTLQLIQHPASNSTFNSFNYFFLQITIFIKHPIHLGFIVSPGSCTRQSSAMKEKLHSFLYKFQSTQHGTPSKCVPVVPNIILNQFVAIWAHFVWYINSIKMNQDMQDKPQPSFWK